LAGLGLCLALRASADEPAAAATPAAATPQAANSPRPHRTFAPVAVVPFTEDSSQAGKVKADLNGVWFAVVNVPIAPGKFKTFPELFKVTSGKEGPTYHLLDVLLPPDVAASIADANKHYAAWQPDAAALKTLQQSWSKLEPAKMKQTAEPLYLKIHYQVIAPDKYGEVFPKRDEISDKVLKASADNFTILIREEYSPRDLGPDSRSAQMIARNTIYGITQVDKDTIKGSSLVEFIAAGAGFPLPYKFESPFVMYRLAK
jgi:hypothetical protein